MGDPKQSDEVGQRPDLASLRARVRAIERGAVDAPGLTRFSLGLGALDAHLGGGLATGRVHEIVGEARGELRDGSSFGFAAALLVRLLATPGAARGGDILWCVRTANMFGGAPYGWGLKALGLDPGRVLFVTARDEAERLWAMEEGLRCPGLAGVVSELGPARTNSVARVAERRLQLAAESSGVTGFLLRSLSGPAAAAGAAESRWHIVAAPSGGDPRPSWSVALERLRAGRPGAWKLFWDPAEAGFRDCTDRVRRPEPRPAARRSTAA